MLRDGSREGMLIERASGMSCGVGKAVLPSRRIWRNLGAPISYHFGASLVLLMIELFTCRDCSELLAGLNFVEGMVISDWSGIMRD